MELTPNQRKELRTALISAFPQPPLLDLMIQDALGKDLNQITHGQPTYELTVQELVNWASSQGRLRELVVGASQQNSGNPKLKAFAGSNPVAEPESLTAKQLVGRFRGTASAKAQELADMMAVLPVNWSVLRLLQKNLEQAAGATQDTGALHLAEIFLSGLLRPVPMEARADQKPGTPQPYDFVEGVREVLLGAIPISEAQAVGESIATQIFRQLPQAVQDRVNADIARRFEESPGYFQAFLIPDLAWGEEAAAKMLPFAQVTGQVLRRWGESYAALAEALERGGVPTTPVFEDTSSLPLPSGFPPLQTLEFVTAQLVEPSTVQPFPPLQTQEVEVVTILIESQPDGLEPFEFVVATLEREIEPRPSGSSSVLPMPPTLPGLSSSVLPMPPPLPGISSSVPPLSSSDFSQNLSQRSGSSIQWVIRRQTQQAWQWVEQLDSRIQLEMVAVPAGRFIMGSPEDELERSTDEGPQHEVELDSFIMGRYPVTQAQWRVVAAMPQINRALEPNLSRFKGDERPVEQVSWYDAVEFCERLSAHTGRDYRLPTEAEWEYACRAGTTNPFHFGETITTDLANYRGTDDERLKSSGSYGQGPKGAYRKETTAVDHFGVANAFGLCEMHGNVFEWCQDHWHENYEGAPTDGSAWFSEKEDARRVLRGGSWTGEPRICRSASRGGDSPNVRYPVGFRVVCSAPRPLPIADFSGGIVIGGSLKSIDEL